jgi:hypothetical protein
MKRLALILIIACVSILSGCATPTVTAHVTSFQRWPADAAGQTYAFAAVPEVQAQNLEYRSYLDMVRAEMGRTGLVEAPAGKPARFTVAVAFGATPTTIMVSRPVDPFFDSGVFGPRWRRGGAGWSMGYWGPNWIDVPVAAYRNSLTLTIQDAAQGGMEVYRSTATMTSGREDMLTAMPYLVRAIFENFPGNNGAEREVEYPAQ